MFRVQVMRRFMAYPVGTDVLAGIDIVHLYRFPAFLLMQKAQKKMP